jgi:hypothetical protein
MAKHLGYRKLIWWPLPIVILMAVAAMPGHAQAKPASSAPAEAKSVEVTQKPEQTSEAGEKAEPTPPASPEEIRQAQIESDTKRLFQLAAELRDEVGKTYKDSLSLTVLKKAEEVEKLAKSLKVRLSKEATDAARRHDR